MLTYFKKAKSRVKVIAWKPLPGVTFNWKPPQYRLIIIDNISLNFVLLVFLDVDNSHGPYKLIFTSTGVPYDRKWRILVSFLTNYDACKAPPRCLQYYTDISGTISSFNYGGAVNAPMLLNNQVGWFIDKIIAKTTVSSRL